MAGIHIDEATVLNDYFKWLKSLVNAEESGEITDKVIITCADEADLYSTLVNLGAAMVVKPSQKDFTMKGLQSELCDENGKLYVTEGIVESFSTELEYEVIETI